MEVNPFEGMAPIPQIYRHAKTSHHPQKYPYLLSDNGAAVNLYVFSQKCSVVKMGDGKVLEHLPAISSCFESRTNRRPICLIRHDELISDLFKPQRENS